MPPHPLVELVQENPEILEMSERRVRLMDQGAFPLVIVIVRSVENIASLLKDLRQGSEIVILNPTFQKRGTYVIIVEILQSIKAAPDYGEEI